ncbi:MAG: MiaB/RimO family radical SAM methylthiotransferase [Limisphaerales bacterium]
MSRPSVPSSAPTSTSAPGSKSKAKPKPEPKAEAKSKSKSADRPRRVGLISLGCAKNLVDAEIMLGALLKDGVEIVNDPTEADALIVNTCSFIDAAQEESVDTILESTELREKRRPDQAVIVSGCLPQRFRDDLPKLMPEVDAFMGIDQVEQVGRIVDQAIAGRGAKLDAAAGSPTTSVGKGTVQTRLAELDATQGADTSTATEATRGVHGHAPGREAATRDGADAGDKPARNRTRTMVGTPPTKPATPPASEGSSAIEVHLRPQYVPHWDTPRFRLTPAHFAYVKIAEGCNHPCSFCIIPRMRGSHRSRAQADIVEEARRLIADGVKELNLISQDSTYYGLDLRPKASRAIASPDRFRAATRALAADATTLCTLLRELNALPGEFWIRLLYTHPAHWTDELITTIAECPKVARYVDMPLQHIHDDMLTRMRRETDGNYIRELLARIRSGIPGIAIRTTFIVGFPGETAVHFQALLDFIAETRFERLGVFAYSQEQGTIAGRMEKQVPPSMRAKRRDRAMAAQHAVAGEISGAFVGRTIRVLVEGSARDEQLRQANVFSWEHGLIRESAGEAAPTNSGPYSVARGEADAPDIDGRVYVRGRLPAGTFVDVRVVGHTTYDLIAEPVRGVKGKGRAASGRVPVTGVR